MITAEIKNMSNQSTGSITQTPAVPTASDIIEQPSPWERLTLASGIIAAALPLSAAAIFIAFIAPHLPALDAPAAQAAVFYREMSQSAIYHLVSYLGEAQMLFLLLFFGGLFGLLRRTEGGSGSLAATVFAAGVILAVIAPLAIMIEDHLLLGTAAAGVDPVIVRTNDGLGPLSFALSGFPQVVVLVGTALLSLSKRLVPRWIGWLGFVVATLSLVGTGTPTMIELFPFAVLAMLLFKVWLLALSIALLKNTYTASQPMSQNLLA